MQLSLSLSYGFLHPKNKKRVAPYLRLITGSLVWIFFLIYRRGMNHVISIAQICNGSLIWEWLLFSSFSAVFDYYFWSRDRRNRKIRWERRVCPVSWQFSRSICTYTCTVHTYTSMLDHPSVWHGTRHAEKKTMSCCLMCMYPHQSTYSNAKYPSFVISLVSTAAPSKLRPALFCFSRNPCIHVSKNILVLVLLLLKLSDSFKRGRYNREQGIRREKQRWIPYNPFSSRLDRLKNKNIEVWRQW